MPTEPPDWVDDDGNIIPSRVPKYIVVVADDIVIGYVESTSVFSAPAPGSPAPERVIVDENGNAIGHFSDDGLPELDS